MAERISHRDDLDRLRREAHAVVASLPEPTPPFTFSIGWSETYDDLFTASFVEVTDIHALMDRALDAGRVILHARGGAAKTVILHRVMRRAVRQDVLPILIDLKAWTLPDYELLRRSETPADRIQFLFARYSS